MKKFNLKPNSNLLVSGGLLLLGVAQMLLSNKKEHDAMNELEEKVVGKVMDKLNSEKN